MSGPRIPVEGILIRGTESPTVVTKLCYMFPNPDFEIVKIFAPAAFELESIRIETQSIPLPQAVWLLGSGLIGLLAVRRKFRKK